MIWIAYLLPFLFAAINRIRGMIKMGGVLGGVATAGLVFAVTLNAIAAGLAGVLYIAGESWGWGKWLLALPHWGDKTWQNTYNINYVSRTDGHSNGVHFVANLLAKETENFSSYCFIALIVRGIVWWLPVYAALLAAGVGSIIGLLVATAIVGITFPFSYYFSFNIGGITRYWDFGEISYGFFQGLALAIFLLI